MSEELMIVNVSGGLTSATMAYLCSKKEPWASRKRIHIFANTGAEHPETLDFIQRLDDQWKLGIVWVESQYGEDRSHSHRVVTHSTASRNGEPFEEMAKHYGVPNVGTGTRCTRELKIRAMRSYLRSLGLWPRNYHTAIGIRADEIDRMSPNAERDRLVYPLITLGVTKADVLAWWADKPWRLNLPEYLGNCMTCYKKSDRKLYTIARERPESFDIFARIEERHGMAGYSPTVTGESARFFRNKRSAQDMLKEGAEWTGESWQPPQQRSFALCEALDAGDGGCDESCEPME